MFGSDFVKGDLGWRGDLRAVRQLGWLRHERGTGDLLEVQLASLRRSEKAVRVSLLQRGWLRTLLRHQRRRAALGCAAPVMALVVALAVRGVRGAVS